MAKKSEEWKGHITFLRSVAEKKNISNSKIGSLCGYHRSTIGRVFDLEFCPKHQMVLDIAKALEVQLEMKE